MFSSLLSFCIVIIDACEMCKVPADLLCFNEIWYFLRISLRVEVCGVMLVAFGFRS